MRIPTLVLIFQLCLAAIHTAYSETVATLHLKTELAPLAYEPIRSMRVPSRSETIVVTRAAEQTLYDYSIEKVMRLDAANSSLVEMVSLPSPVTKLTNLLDISPRSGKLLVELSFVHLYIFDPYSGSLELVLEDFESVYSNAIFGASDEILIAQAENGVVGINITSSAVEVLVPMDTLPWPGGTPWMRLSVDGKYLVAIYAGIRSQSGFILNLEQGSIQSLALPFLGAGAYFSPDGQRLITVGANFLGPYFVYEYDLATGSLMRSLQFTESEDESEGDYYGNSLPFIYSDDSSSLVTFLSGDAYVFDLNEWGLVAKQEWALGVSPTDLLGGSLSNDHRRIEILEQSGKVIELLELEGFVIDSSITSEDDSHEIHFASKENHHYRLQQSSDLVDWILSDDGINGNGETLTLPFDRNIDSPAFGRVVEFSKE